MTNPDPATWVGRTEICVDALDPGHVRRVALSLGDDAGRPLAQLPPLWHWAFFVEGQPYTLLGEDGHPRRGGFLPPADGRNRMWAGGRLEFHRPLRVGQPGERCSRIAAVTEKTGRTGRLLFVTVEHRYSQDDALCILEEQDIVYREPSPPILEGTRPAPECQWSETVVPDPVMLFRYSAVTFNGHRIHYDAPYARDVEGYPGLVVHGPLIATSMVQAFLRAHPGARILSLSYRGVRPLIAPRPFQVSGRIGSEGEAELWAEQDGTLAHQASLRFEA
ncbi:MAG: MaoC family dehydratase N-terminal domain-containing protein [Castellaniella sp.]|uniref:FAS1-like dehydratase domain-containing protein n=1 Tax=Castellaniella sp. TaxID=1955812 RepID=UPI002A361175|nr:MaoC family dehydratase N-terminal domain-containing protein [Castellaniella sp.]MDY0309571.1 MaoC family dehydratase N-terminal domain-containing protein [Castellaniella sp.]